MRLRVTRLPQMSAGRRPDGRRPACAHGPGEPAIHPRSRGEHDLIIEFGGYGVDHSMIVGIITTMNSKQVIKQLEADGWYLARVKGSHHQFKHPSRPGLVTVKHPDSDIPAGTLGSIKKQAGWK